MHSVRASVHVHRPSEAVWEYLTDWSRYPEWDSLTASAEQIDDGPARVGTRFRWVSKALGRRVAVQSAITEWEPLRRMAYVITTGPALAVGSGGWKALSPAGEGCVLEVGVSLAPAVGRLAAPVSDPVFTWWLRRTMGRDLQRLRTILQASPASGAPVLPTSVETITVARDPVEVWTYLIDLSHQREWDGLTVSCEQLDAGPQRVGTRYRWKLRLMGRPVSVESHLTSWDPPRRMDYAVTTGPVRGHGWTAVYARPQGGCEVERGLVAAAGVGRVVRLVSNQILARWTSRSERRNLRRLRTILEGTTTPVTELRSA